MAAKSDDGLNLLRDSSLSSAQIMSSRLCTLCLFSQWMTYPWGHLSGVALISTSADAAGGVQPAEDHCEGS